MVSCWINYIRFHASATWRRFKVSLLISIDQLHFVYQIFGTYPSRPQLNVRLAMLLPSYYFYNTTKTRRKCAVCVCVVSGNEHTHAHTHTHKCSYRIGFEILRHSHRTAPPPSDYVVCFLTIDTCCQSLTNNKFICSSDFRHINRIKSYQSIWRWLKLGQWKRGMHESGPTHN